MNYEVVIQKIEHRTGIENRDRIVDAWFQILHALARPLPQMVRQRIYDALPQGLSDALEPLSSSPVEAPQLERTVEEVAQQSSFAEHEALEYLQVVCEVLAEELPSNLLKQVERELHPTIGELLRPRGDNRLTYGAPNIDRQGVDPPAEQHRTLARGKSGSTHPISEGRVAQRDSLARDKAPEQERALSSTEGRNAERRKDTLSEGKPGSHNPLSDGS